MRVITGRGVNQIWDQAKYLMNSYHIVRPSRVGEVWECPEPVTTVYTKPCERAFFNVERNASPWFMMFESLWMLAGRNDIAFLEKFNSKIKDFVGPGPLLPDAYGYRWRKAFDLDGGAEDDYADQLKKIIRMLKKNPDERRAVLTMWNPLWDLERPELPSVPCNLVVSFKIRSGVLNMTVFCRSNDLCFGAYSANSSQFGFLLEYMAAMIGLPVGTYWQISDSWHAYTERWEKLGGLSTIPTRDYYAEQNIVPYPLVENPETFDDELQAWMEDPSTQCENKFFPLVAAPLYYSWEAYKRNDIKSAILIAGHCQSLDWKIAATQWLERIAANRLTRELRG